MQEVAKLYYYQEQYDSAYYYYDKFVNIRKENGLNIYPQEDLKIGIVYEKMGLDSLASNFYTTYTEYCESDQSIYQPASMAVKLLHEGNFDLAMEQLENFSTQNNYQYWILVFMEIDPLIKPLKNHPDYKRVMKKNEGRFWKN